MLRQRRADSSVSGLQLYTVRRDMDREFEGTLRTVAGIGYKEVEFAGYFGRTPAAVRATLDRLGLAAPSAHIGTPATLTKDWEKTIDAGEVMGHKYLIVTYIEEKDRRTLDDYCRYADLFNSAGETARKAGMRLGYHNHDFEFAPLDGKLPYDLLLERTLPTWSRWRWIFSGSRKAGEIRSITSAGIHGDSRRCMSRTWTAHRISGWWMSVEAGSISRAFLRSGKAGIRYFFVKHDDPQPSAIESVKTSFQYLKRLKF